MSENQEEKQALEDLRDSLGDLRTITRLLQRYAFLALVFTILNFGALIVSVCFRFFSFSGILNTASRFIIEIYVPILLTLTAVLTIVRYEILRKRGDALFEEISDELQWNIKRAVSTTEERPMLTARVALRSFARATDLPLIPGKFGPGLYATINFLLVFLVVYFFIFIRF